MNTDPQRRHCSRFRTRRRSRIAAYVLALLALTGMSGPFESVAAGDPIAYSVFQRLQEARQNRLGESFERRAELDAVAAARAETIAALPHARRLNHAEPIGSQLRAAGIRWFRNVSMHLDMARGYRQPAAGFMRSWSQSEQAWAKVVDPRFQGIGLASRRAEDGWIVLVVILVEDLDIPRDLPALERRVVEEVNVIRREHRLAPLARNDRLSAVARGHSQAMADGEFVEHVDRQGRAPADRVEQAGLFFRSVGENIHVNRGAADPVRHAVEGWMDSRGHRKQILNADFRETGVGIVLNDDGVFYFTQLFLRPRD